MKRFTMEETETVRQLYPTQGKRGVSALLGRDPESVRKVAQRLGLKGPPQVYRRVAVPKERVDQIVAGYSEKRTIASLGKEHGYGMEIVRRVLVDAGVRIRTFGEHAKKHTLNETYFDIIDTHEKAYILGFLYADGNISADKNSPNTYTLQIRLAVKDRGILEQIRAALGSSHPIYTVANNTGYCVDCEAIGLSITSRRLCESLFRLGVTPRKSLTLTFPTADQVPDEYLGAFVLGYFDGDGSVVHNLSNQKWSVNLCGTDEFLMGLHVTLAERFGAIPRRLQHHRNEDVNMWRTGWGGRTVGRAYRCRDIWHIYHFFYSGHSLGLARKKERMTSIVRHYSE